MSEGQYLSSRRLKLFIRVIISLVILAAIIFTIYEIVQDKSVVSVGEKAPDFKLQTMDGQTVKLSDFRGKGVVLNFWASWCNPCKSEMPYLNEADRQHLKGVKIIAVNIRETSKTVQNFFKEHDLNFTTILDKKGNVTKTYNVVKIPSTFLIDKNGVVVKKMEGPMASTAEVIQNMKLIQP